MSVWILQGKLAPPAPPADWQRRSLWPVPPAAAVLHAGPGRGKTLALLSAWEEARDEGLPAIWYNVDAVDNDPAAFFQHLTAAVRAHIPQFGEGLAALAGSEPEPKRLWAAFFAHLSSFNLPGLFLAFDDFQHQPALAAGLAALTPPPGVRWVLASRLPVPGALVLGEAQLAAPPPDAEALYLRQPPERRAFMLDASLLEELTPAACQAVLAADGRAARPGPSPLDQLAQEQLLFKAAHGDSYRFPTYLKEFLRAEADRAIPFDRRAALHRRAAAHHLAAGQPEVAVAHLLACADWEGAKQVAATLFPLMRFDGRHVQLRRWLEAFPLHDPWLQLWRGHMLAREGASEAALACYRRAREGYEAAADQAGVFKAQVCLLNTHMTLADDGAIAAALAKARAHPGPRHDEDEVDLWLIRAADGERQGDLAAMRACNEAALGTPVNGNIEIAASHCIAHMNLFTYALHHGELARARRHIGEAAAIAAAWPFYPYRLAAGFLEASLCLLEGDAGAAGRLLEPLLSDATWADVLDWHDRGIALTTLGHYHQARGDVRAAEEAFNRALVVFNRAGSMDGRKVPLERLMWLALQRKQPARVEAFWREAGGPGEQPGLHDLALVIPAARARQLAGRPGEALEALVPAREGLDALGAGVHVARALLYESAALASLDRHAEGVERRERALGLVERAGYRFLLDQDQLLWEELRTLEAPGPVALPPRDETLTLRCFGPFEARLGGVILDQWPRRKARLLLAALALHPAGLTEAELAALVGGVSLNVWALRRVLEPQLAKGEASRYVTREGERYVLAAGSDLAACEEAFRTPDVEAYERGLALMRGPLLADMPAFAAERAAWQARTAEAVAWLGAQYRRQGSYQRAKAAIARGLAIAPTAEGIYLAAMQLHRSLGEPEQVRRAYWDCRRALKAAGLGAPTPAFEAAYVKLQ